jgi:N-acetylglucosaminyl-diphospho-decaprenol L-rhamnosyltransferase
VSPGLGDRLTVVLLTHDCEPWIDLTLDRLAALEIPVVAVDNASRDGTRALLSRRPWLRTRFLTSNTGAAGRNEGVRAVTTPYVVFCDDDGWWERDGLERAVDLLDRHERLALVNARIVVGVHDAPDPISAEMAASPLADRHEIPGPVLLSFMGGACVLRVSAYEAAGGYDPTFFIGGEEETLAFPLLHLGWAMRYDPDVVMHHLPSQVNASRIRHFGVRNTLWNAWIHRPLRGALAWTWFTLRWTPHDRAFVRGVVLAVRGLPWALRRRRPLPEAVDRDLALLDGRRQQAARAARAAGHRGHLAPKYPTAAEGAPV